VLIPIGHDQGVRRWPYVTVALIAICTIIHVYGMIVEPTATEFLEDPDVIEKLPIFKLGYLTGSGISYRLVTCAFVHGDWLHLIGNMLFLWLAGSAVEDRWGHHWFAVFYLVAGGVSSFVFNALYDGSPTHLIGASGAISALMGAFLVHFSKTNIMFWYWFYARSGTFLWPAYYALPAWLAEQLLTAAWTSATEGATQIAYSAHIGGFLFGAGAAYALRGVFKGYQDDGFVSEPLPVATAVSVPVSADDRAKQLLDAIAARDLGAVRRLASRTILDVSRTGADARVVELWKAMRAQFERAPLTDGAFVAVANAADKLADKPTFIAVAEAALAEHPGSNQIPKVMWRLAEHRRDDGNVDGAIELLRTLASRFPRDVHGQRARDALESRGLMAP
jgi:membrane associated rhomboid family serine protease